MSNFSLSLYNNLLSLPLILLGMLLNSEFPAFFRIPQWKNPSFCLLVLLSGLSALGISISSNWCIARTSPSTYSLVGSFNKFPLTIIGIFLFRTPLTWLGSIFTFISLIGGSMLFFVKQSQVAKPREIRYTRNIRRSRTFDEADEFSKIV